MNASIAENIQKLAIQFPPFVIAIVFHEFAHGLIAYQWGDKTAQEQGRLTLNPVPHIDPIGTLLFPLINMITGIPLLFGWAKPVPIDPRRFRKYRPALFFVSLAGVGMNVLLALFSAAALCSMLRWMPTDFYLFEPLTEMAKVSIVINFALAIFNLLPLPPLDGSKVIQAFLSPKATMNYEKLSRYSFIILLALLWTNAFTVLNTPIMYLSNTVFAAMVTLFRLPGSL